MKKIMFNDRFGLTDAVLSGSKTQTRRIISNKHLEKLYGNNNFYNNLKGKNNDFIDSKINEILLPCSKYSKHETVAVAQSYDKIQFSHEKHPNICSPSGLIDIRLLESFAWVNKMFVKADLMPHQIKITNVRVERLQEISNEDCMKEGILYFGAGYYFIGDRTDGSEISYISHSDGRSYKAYGTPQKAYEVMIDKISGKGTWKRNPYVLVYDFELVK